MQADAVKTYSSSRRVAWILLIIWWFLSLKSICCELYCVILSFITWITLLDVRQSALQGWRREGRKLPALQWKFAVGAKKVNHVEKTQEAIFIRPSGRNSSLGVVTPDILRGGAVKEWQWVQRCRTSAKLQCTQTLQIFIRWVMLMRWMTVGNVSDARRLVVVHCAHQRHWLFCMWIAGFTLLSCQGVKGSFFLFFYWHCFTSFPATWTRKRCYSSFICMCASLQLLICIVQSSSLADLKLVVFSGCKCALVSRVYTIGVNVNVL